MTDLEKRIPTISLGEFRAYFAGLPDDTRIGFSGLTPYRPKWRGKTLNVEFNEHVYRNAQGIVVIEPAGQAPE